jgi:hypothetical protein
MEIAKSIAPNILCLVSTAAFLRGHFGLGHRFHL